MSRSWIADLSSRPQTQQSDSDPVGHRAHTRAEWLASAFMTAWLGLLLGYGLMGKGFAYIGVPPLFVGEVVLLLGLVAWSFVPLKGLPRLPLPALLLVFFIVVCALRTFPFVATYKTDALRDGAIWGYSLFAFVVARIVGDSQMKFDRVIVAFRKFIPLFLTVGIVSFIISTYAGESLPRWPGSGTPILGPMKGGDFLVHLGGVFAFLAATRTDRPWHLVMIAIALILNFTGRAGMLSFCAAAGVIALLGSSGRAVGIFGGLAVGAIAFLWISGLAISVPGTSRSISFEQLQTNVSTLTSSSSGGVEEGTKRWRLDWWNSIVDYTMRGPYFWQGKGFGINLADDDGFQVSEDKSLRSPHNGHLTLLARGGVPALVLWIAVQASWAGLMLRAWWRARRDKQPTWVAIFATLLAYWLAFLVNATFDVYLEGPVGGIWFWSVFGFGLAAVRIAARQAQQTAEPTRSPGDDLGFRFAGKEASGSTLRCLPAPARVTVSIRQT